MQLTYDVTDKEFIKAVERAGYKIPHPVTMEALDYNYPGQYSKRLQKIWDKCKNMEILKVSFNKQEWEVEIPLTIKGQLWCWVLEKPVANHNPYKTLFDTISKPVKMLQDDIVMFLSTDNIPDNFDKRTKYNESWVKEDSSLSVNEIRIELKPVERVSFRKEYMEAIKNYFLLLH